jgi:hypothetical protein
MRPSLDEFKDLLRKAGGNLTKAAALVGVTRQTVWGWAKSDPEFQDALKDERKRVFDKCLDVAYAVAMGVPKVNENKEFVGWEEKPDSNMLRYLLSTLGRDEGFGEKHDVNIENQLPTAINIVCTPKKDNGQ